MVHPNLQRKYGVVRCTGTELHHTVEELIFQADDPAEAIGHMKQACVAGGWQYSHKIICKDDSDETAPIEPVQ